MPKYVFSTLTASQQYPIYSRIPGRDLPRLESFVRIHGGANLPSKVLVTPLGVMTPITEDEYERLLKCSGFRNHVKLGFLTVEDRPHDPEKAAKNMQPKDASAPMVPKDFEDAGTTPPSTGTASQDDDLDTRRVSSTQRPAQAETRTSAEIAEAEKVAAKAQKKAAKKAAKEQAAADNAGAAEKTTRQRRGGAPQTDA